MTKGSSTIIIRPEAGGLGDQLIYSTLPKCYSERGYDVYVSSATPFRNPEISKIVWEMNPFVRGFSDASQSIHPENLARAFRRSTQQSVSPIQAMEALHGFAPQHLYPYVGYKPSQRSDFRGKIVADPRSISQTFAPRVFAEFVVWMARWNDFDPKDVIVIEGRYAGNLGAKTLPKNERYRCSSIFEYADVIASSGLFLVTESGGHSLACALKADAPEPRIASLFSTEAFNDRLVTYPNAHYCVTGRSGPDFTQRFAWDPPRRRARWPWAKS
jgi:hypothetical protein